MGDPGLVGAHLPSPTPAGTQCQVHNADPDRHRDPNLANRGWDEAKSLNCLFARRLRPPTSGETQNEKATLAASVITAYINIPQASLLPRNRSLHEELGLSPGFGSSGNQRHGLAAAVPAAATSPAVRTLSHARCKLLSLLPRPRLPKRGSEGPGGPGDLSLVEGSRLPPCRKLFRWPMTTGHVLYWTLSLCPVTNSQCIFQGR